jgi:molybdopterin-guanine dinucleotide biosynthesis protein A
MGGADKAFLRDGRQIALRRTIDLLRTAFPEVVVVASQPEKFREYDVIVTCDEFPGLGPLAGIHAAMGRVERDYVFVLACDMPFVQRSTVAYLVDRLAGQDALIPRWEDDIEPLHGIYARRIRSDIEAALREGVTAIRSFLPAIRAEFIDEREMREIPGAAQSFLNINTPEDAARFHLSLDGTHPRHG